MPYSLNRQVFLIAIFSVCLYLCLFLFSSAVSAASAATVGRIEIHGLHSIEREEMLNMLGFKEGDSLDAKTIETAIKRSFRKGIFDSISIESSDDTPSLVTVQVREKEMIRKIIVQGNYPLSARRVRELLLLKEGEMMRFDLVDQASAELRAHFALLGFPDAKIEIMPTETAKHHLQVILTVTIEVGTPLIVKDLKIIGTDLIAINDLKISAGDIYDQVKVGKELQRIKDRLKKDGYYKPAVGPYNFQSNILTIAINPGKKLQTVIDGNSALSVKRLEKETPFFDGEVFSDEAVDEAVSRMTSLYHKEGYPFAQIAAVASSDEQEVQVTFFVYEGKNTKVRAIEFSGATITPKNLQSVLALKEGGAYNPDLRESDRNTLRDYYSTLGFLNASVKEIETRIDDASGSVDLVVSIDEGMKTTIGAIDIKGVTKEKRENLLALISIKEGNPYNEIEISDARYKILDQYAREGYASIDVAVERVVDKNTVAVSFTITENKKKTIGKTVVAGNERTRYRVIKREIEHAEGSPYSVSLLAQERQKLYKLGLFSEVEIEASDAEGDKKDLLVRVKEGNAGTFEFGFGYAEYEQFRSFFEVGYRNLFGMNRQGLLRTEISSLEQRFMLQYIEPRFLGTSLPLRVIYLHEHKKEISIPSDVIRYKLARDTLSAGIEKKITDSLRGEFYYEFSLVKTTDVQPDVVLSRQDVGTLVISSIRSSLIFDTRDNPFEPKKGIHAEIAVKIASPVLLSETHFYKLNASVRSFHQLSKRIVLGLSAQGGIATGFGNSTELPIVERYFLGGRSSVRGYEQDMLGPKGSDGNPTGGNLFVMGSVELRTDVGRNVSIVPFFDFGNVWVKAGDFSPSDIRYTAGIGLRYATPVGPLRIDYGFKLNRGTICEERTAPSPPHCYPESPGELHFSIGHAF
jgi:outer membrane protein insertion porin family